MRINAFFHAYGRSFSFRYQTYVTSYSIYTATTIDIVQIRHNDPHVSSAAIERLKKTLSALETETTQIPGIQRNVEIIQTQLASISEPSQIPPTQEDSHRDPPSVWSNLQTNIPDITGVSLDESGAASQYTASDWNFSHEIDLHNAGAGFDPAFDIVDYEDLFMFP